MALAGQRVLEIGPANGFLTFEMESQGAEVVSVELSPDAEWDVVPVASLDIKAVRAERSKFMQQLRNGYWFAHRSHDSTAKVHYGSVYSLPDGLERFDVAVMASVLVHLRDPLGAIQECARLTDKTIVITEMHDAELGQLPIARLVPSKETSQWHTWWSLTPALLVQFLEVIGFNQIAVSHHHQTYSGREIDELIPMVTIVASRP